jgi:hypothetical protein
VRGRLERSIRQTTYRRGEAPASILKADGYVETVELIGFGIVKTFDNDVTDSFDPSVKPGGRRLFAEHCCPVFVRGTSQDPVRNV